MWTHNAAALDVEIEVIRVDANKPAIAKCDQITGRNTSANGAHRAAENLANFSLGQQLRWKRCLFIFWVHCRLHPF